MVYEKSKFVPLNLKGQLPNFRLLKTMCSGDSESNINDLWTVLLDIVKN